MKTIGIIAEFNPFHNGHRYLLEQARKQTGADYLVIAMSGSFVQRGAPAWQYKYDRVKAALSNGADAVFELPVSYSTATAESFAFGGVSLLGSLGCIDGLVFGSECGDTDRLSAVSRLLSHPDADYKDRLEAGLKNGMTFPAARASALPEYKDILGDPNNILGIEYIKALSDLNSRILPLTIQRISSAYHGTSLGPYASSEAIRRVFSEEGFSDLIKESVPEEVLDALTGLSYTPIELNDMSHIAGYLLLTSSSDHMQSLQDMNPDIANRFLNCAGGFTDIESFLVKCKTKELTYTRLSRALLHVILDLPDLTHDKNGKLIPCPYTRLLGFRKDARPLLHKISEASDIPVITKAADAKDQLDENAIRYFEASVRADRIYDMLINSQKKGTRLKDGYRISPIII